jgi:hypothetical protein
LCRDEWEVDWFVRMNNTGGPVDVWAVDRVDEAELMESPEGHHYSRRRFRLSGCLSSVAISNPAPTSSPDSSSGGHSRTLAQATAHSFGSSCRSQPRAAS